MKKVNVEVEVESNKFFEIGRNLIHFCPRLNARLISGSCIFTMSCPAYSNSSCSSSVMVSLVPMWVSNSYRIWRSFWVSGFRCRNKLIRRCCSSLMVNSAGAGTSAPSSRTLKLKKTGVMPYYRQTSRISRTSVARRASRPLEGSLPITLSEKTAPSRLEKVYRLPAASASTMSSIFRGAFSCLRI